MLAPNVCLAGIPLVLLTGFVLLALRRWNSAWSLSLHLLTIAAAAILSFAGLGEALHGSNGSLQIHPIDAFATGLAGTTSGYATACLALLGMGVIVIAREMSSRTRSLATLALLGLAVACLGDGMLALGVGLQLMWVAWFAEANGRGALRRESLLGLLVVQAAAGCLIGAAAWQQTASSTTSFGAIPAAAGGATAIAWALSAVLASGGAALLLVDGDRPEWFGATAVVAGLFVYIDLTRLHNVVDPSMPPAAAAVLICAAIVFAVGWVWRSVAERSLLSSVRWLWLGTISLLLISAAFAAATFDPLPVMGMSVTLSALALSLCAACRPALRVLCILAATGWFAGVVATSGAAVTASATEWHDAAGRLAGLLCVLLAVGGLRVAWMSRRTVAAPSMRDDLGAAAAIAAFFAVGFLPGLLESSVWAWLSDTSTAPQRTFSVILPVSLIWPGGIVAFVSVAIAGSLLSIQEVLGMRQVHVRPKTVVTGGSLLSRWTVVADWCAPVVKWAGDADNWLAVEPRFGSVIMLAVAALVILH